MFHATCSTSFIFCVQGVLGYVILRPLMTAVGVVAQLLGVYGDGKLRFDCVYLYTTIISNLAQVLIHSCPGQVQYAVRYHAINKFPCIGDCVYYL